MKEVERLFWAVGLLLLLPFAVQHGFKVNSLNHIEAPTLQSAGFGISAAPAVLAPMWNAAYEAPQENDYLPDYTPTSGFQPSAYTPRQAVKQLARLTVPTLQIDLPVLAGAGKPGSHHVEVITAGDLDSGKHIGLATCFDGDAQTLAQRLRGQWLFLQTQNRLRQYRVIDVRAADPNSPSLPSPAFHSITLVTCFPGYDPGEHLLLVTAIEVNSGGEHLNTSSQRYLNQLKF